MSKYKAGRRNWFFPCAVSSWELLRQKSTEQKEEAHVFMQPTTRSTAGENTCQPSTCVPVSTERAQDAARTQQREFLQPLTRLSCPPQVHAKANLLSRPTGESAGGAHLAGGTQGAVLGAGIHLSACCLFLFHSCPGLAGDDLSSNPSNPNTSQSGTTPPAASSSCSFQPHLPDPTHPTAVRKPPIQHRGQTSGRISPLHPREPCREAREAGPAGTVLAAAACRHTEMSAGMEKQQNSSGFGGGEGSSDKSCFPPSAAHPAPSAVRTRGLRKKLNTQRLG